MGSLLRARGVQMHLQWALLHPSPSSAGAATACVSRGLATGASAAAPSLAASSASASARKPAAAAAAARAAASAAASATKAAAAAATGGIRPSRTVVAAAASSAAALPLASSASCPPLPPLPSLPLLLRSLAQRQQQPTLQQQQQQPPPHALASLARRAFASTSLAPRWAQQQAQQPQQQAGAAKQAADAAAAAAEAAEAADSSSLELTEEKMRAITDKIPQRPVGIVEGTSYTLLIAAAFATLAFFAYNFVTTFLLEPAATACFNAAAQRLRADPRITVRLGADITAYGQESASRAARQAVPHVMYKDAQGVEHCRLQFHLRGAGGAVALVNADMYRAAEAGAGVLAGAGAGGGIGGGGATMGGGGGGGGGMTSGGGGAWEYAYLIADVATPGGGPGGARPQQQRLVIVAPR